MRASQGTGGLSAYIKEKEGTKGAQSTPQPRSEAIWGGGGVHLQGKNEGGSYRGVFVVRFLKDAYT